MTLQSPPDPLVDERYWDFIPGERRYHFKAYPASRLPTNNAAKDEVALIKYLRLRKRKVSTVRPAMRPRFWYLVEEGSLVGVITSHVSSVYNETFYRMWLGNVYHGMYANRRDALRTAELCLLHERLRGGYNPARFARDYGKDGRDISELMRQVDSYQKFLKMRTPSPIDPPPTLSAISAVRKIDGKFIQDVMHVEVDDTFEGIYKPDDREFKFPRVRGS